MHTKSASSGRIRFADFEVDVESHELLRSGRRVRLQEKSFLVLSELLRNPGRVVTRRELAAALWPAERHVDAEHGLNTAVRRLRAALDDSAEDARFVETLPRLGYRFIGTVEIAGEPLASPQSGDSTTTGATSSPRSPVPAPLPGSGPPEALRARRRAALYAGAIVGALALGVAAYLLARTWSTRTDAPPATTVKTDDAVGELLARSRYLRNHKRFDEAKKLVEEALQLEPKNADALAGLALDLLHEGRYEQGREMAKRALELDPSAHEAHRALAYLARGAGDMVATERHLRRAVAAAPGDYKSLNRLARHLLECGRIGEAKELILETRRLAPDDPDVQNIWIEYALRIGDYEDAIRRGELWTVVWGVWIETLENTMVNDMLGLAYVGARRFEDAIAQFRIADPEDDLRLALALGHAGREAEARAILEDHDPRDTTPTGSPPSAASPADTDPGRAGALAMAYITVGDFDRAFESLDEQVAARWYPGWLHCPLFHPIRRDPRWPAFARRLEREFFTAVESPELVFVPFFHQPWPRPDPSPPVQSGRTPRERG